MHLKIISTFNMTLTCLLEQIKHQLHHNLYVYECNKQFSLLKFGYGDRIKDTISILPMTSGATLKKK